MRIYKKTFLVIFLILLSVILQNMIFIKIKNILNNSLLFSDIGVFIFLINFIALYISMGLDLTVDKYLSTTNKHIYFQKYICLYFNIIIKIFFLVAFFDLTFFIVKNIFFDGHINFIYKINSVIHDNYYFLFISLFLAATFFLAKIIRVLNLTILAVFFIYPCPLILIYSLLSFLYSYNLNKDDILYIYTFSYIVTFVFCLLICLKLISNLKPKAKLIYMKLDIFNFKSGSIKIKDGLFFLTSLTSDYYIYIFLIIIDITSNGTNIDSSVLVSINITLIYVVLVKTVSTIIRPEIKRIKINKLRSYLKRVCLVASIFSCFIFIMILVLGKWILNYYNIYSYSSYIILMVIALSYSIVESINPYKVASEILFTKIIFSYTKYFTIFFIISTIFMSIYLKYLLIIYYAAIRIIHMIGIYFIFNKNFYKIYKN